MKTLILAAALVAGTSTATLAADLRMPVKTPIVATSVWNWTGFYAGANAGYTWSGSNGISTSSVETFSAPTWNTENDASVALATGVNRAKSNGFIGGAQLGYNWQTGNWVYGVETDIQGIASGSGSSSRSGALVPVGFPAELIVSTVTAAKSIDYLGTVRARVGTLVSPAILAYATAGLAYGGVSAGTFIMQTNQPFPPAFFSSGQVSDTRLGWTAGVGAEWMFLQRWSVKAEYLHYDLGRVTYADSPLIFPVSGPVLYSNSPRSTAKFNGDLVRLGVNLHL